VTSRSDRRIDCPLLPGQPPSGQLVSGTHDRASVDGHTGVRSSLAPGRVSGHRRHADHQRGHRGVGAAAAADMATRTTDTCPEPLVPQATAAPREGHHGRYPTAMATQAARAATGAVLCRHPRTLPLGRRRAVQVPDTRGQTTVSGVRPAGAVARGPDGYRVQAACLAGEGWRAMT
jgi:hypothetical protein